ncbi:hypothetical protein B5F10_05835 [Anaerotruncus colihominis]|nr:hypothetical protein B5F10_05835 [Anaerotruncus colihominis]
MQRIAHCAYFTMSAKRHGKIGHQGGSGLRPRIAPAIKGKMTALRLFYHVCEAACKICHQDELNPLLLRRPALSYFYGNMAKPVQNEIQLGGCYEGISNQW